jgi:hypothetical protein
MKLAIQKLRRLRLWYAVYAIYVVVALAGASDAWAEERDEFDTDLAMDMAADAHRVAAAWGYKRSVRIELAGNERVRLEATIPLASAEESRLTLGIARKLSRNWVVNLNLWAML